MICLRQKRNCGNPITFCVTGVIIYMKEHGSLIKKAYEH